MARFMDGSEELLPGLARVAWFDMDAKPMSKEAWDYFEGRVLGLRRAWLVDEEIDLSFLLLNGVHDDIEFQLPKQTWAGHCELDSANPHHVPGPLRASQLPVWAHDRGGFW